MASAALWPAHAEETLVAEIEVSDAWARPTPPGSTVAAAYLTLENTGDDDDALIGAIAPEAAGSVELHTHTHENGVMKMRQVPEIELPMGESVALKPHGLHLMLIDLKTPLEAGQTFPLTLTFEQAGDVDITLEVRQK